MALMAFAGISTTNTSERENQLDMECNRRRFDLKIARDAFISCVQPGNILLLEEYVRAYDELCM